MPARAVLVRLGQLGAGTWGELAAVLDEPVDGLHPSDHHAVMYDLARTATA